MKNLFKRFMVSASVLFISTTLMANTQSAITPTEPPINATAYILMDAGSGEILASKNMDDRAPPASLTKLMTLFIISQALTDGKIKLDDKVRISKKAWKMTGSKMFVKVNDEVLVSDLIQGIVVDSGNDASVAMAEYIAGSEESFVDLMNAQAAALGMTNTHFTDATGFTEPDHYSSARDLAILARTIATEYPEEYKWYAQKWFTYRDIKQSNRNRLLWRYQYADGLKTGHTDAAKYCLVASAVKEDMRLIVVILGAPSDEIRAEDSQKLFTYGFRFFKTVKLFNANTPITTARVYFGEKSTITVGLKHPFYVTVADGLQDRVKTSFIVDKLKYAPIAKGDTLGEITATLGDKTLSTLPLISLEATNQGSLWTSATDYVIIAWHKWIA